MKGSTQRRLKESLCSHYYKHVCGGERINLSPDGLCIADDSGGYSLGVMLNLGRTIVTQGHNPGLELNEEFTCTDTCAVCLA